MTGKAAFAVSSLLLLSACDTLGLSEDQQAVLEALEQPIPGLECFEPELRGTVARGGVNFPPQGFEDLAVDGLDRPDVRVQPGWRTGRIRFSYRDECFPVLLPHISGDRALTGIWVGYFYREFGFLRIDRRWIFVGEGLSYI